MAIVEYSCLVNRIIGLIGNTIYQTFKGTNYIRTSPTTWTNPNSYRQQQIRGNFKQMQQAWDSLSDSYKELWQSFCTSKGSHFFGHQTFVSLNCNLLNASHSDLACILHPPLRPGTPKHVRGFCTYNSINTCVYLGWIEPDSSILYVTGHYRLHRGFCSVNPCYGLCPTVGYRPSWRFIQTVKSDIRQIFFYHNFPDNTRLFFRLNSIDKFGRKSPFTHSLRIYTKTNEYFYVPDYNNHRLMKFKKSDMSFVSKIGSYGSGNDQFAWPKYCCCDHTHVYVSDSNNHRVVKRLKSDLSYVNQEGSIDGGDDQYRFSSGISANEEFYCIVDSENHRIKKIRCSDLSFIAKFGSQGSGDGQFNFPYNLCTDHDYIYVTDTNNHRIVILKKSDLSFVSKFGAEGKGNYLFQNPQGIAVDRTHLYVSDTYNHRIVRYLKPNFTYVDEYGTQGSGDDQLNTPNTIALDIDHIYIADRKNHRIVKLAKSNYAFIDKVGSQGTGNEQFDNPRGVCLDDFYYQQFKN